MIVGIDLGTTNSAIAIWRDDNATLIPNAVGQLLTPSAVSVDENGKILVGNAARDRMATHPEATATSFKRYMGTQRKCRLGHLEMSAEDLSSLVLRALKADAEAFTGQEISDAVITVPAYFNDRQRKATRRAGELAGLTVRRLINEPTAAALAFGVHDRREREPFLVFDLGGGTFDVSIVDMFEGIVEVRASSGDNHLGGDDFNLLLIALMQARVDPQGLLKKLPAVRREALLESAAEVTRRRLSENDVASFEIVCEGERMTAEISASEFEVQVEPLLSRLRDPILRSLRDSRIEVDALSEIVLVGGATRMPVVRRAITRMFGRFPNATVHPDHAVALGAAVQAGLLERNTALDEIRLTDVCPFTLGVEHSQPDGRGGFRAGLFSPIIERNTTVPVSRVGSYRTLFDNQREIEFNIYQGEALDVVSNVKLGSLHIPVPPKPAGQISVDCRFSYDSSGLLEVDVTVPATGLTRNLVILDEGDELSPDEIENRRAALAKLKFHPREEAENVALMARAHKAYEMFVGESRDQIARWITNFETILETQDPRLIGDARHDLAANLEAVEQERFL